MDRAAAYHLVWRLDSRSLYNIILLLYYVPCPVCLSQNGLTSAVEWHVIINSCMLALFGVLAGVPGINILTEKK